VILSQAVAAARYLNSTLFPETKENLDAGAYGFHFEVRHRDTGFPEEVGQDGWVVGEPERAKSELKMGAVAALLGGPEGAVAGSA
jgi:hypothetical protein